MEAQQTEISTYNYQPKNFTYFDESKKYEVGKKYSFKNEPKFVSYTFNEIKINVPETLINIVKCLTKSEKILDLKTNWDGENSEGFSKETWIGVSNFLLNYSYKIYHNYGNLIDLPKIYPSSNGSIDLDWETEKYGMIINVAKGGQSATYYADNKDKQMTEGVFNPMAFNFNLLPKAITENNEN